MSTTHCPSVQELHDLVHGTLEGWKIDAFRYHLRYCERCRDLARDFDEAKSSETAKLNPDDKQRLVIRQNAILAALAPAAPRRAAVEKRSYRGTESDADFVVSLDDGPETLGPAMLEETMSGIKPAVLSPADTRSCLASLPSLSGLRSQLRAEALQNTPMPPGQRSDKPRSGSRPTLGSLSGQSKSSITSQSGRRPRSGLRPIPVAESLPSTDGVPETTQAIIELLEPGDQPEELGRLGPYRLLELLGTGATSAVFLADDDQLGRQVALKVLKPCKEGDGFARHRFLREARSAGSLDHENIIPIYQVGEDRGLPYLAMKYLQGETLDSRLKRDKQLLACEALRISREIATGLQAAHDPGVVHRDIKPANIFLEGPAAHVRIVDFGLARPISEDLHLTRTGTVLGTPAYMSPEQARGEQLDHRTDLFSLGCVMYRMLTGRTPFQANDTMGMLVALAQDQPPPIQAFNPDVPGQICGLVMQLLAKRPEGRPQSAEAVAVRIQEAEKSLNESANVGKLLLDLQQTEKRPNRQGWVTFAEFLALGAIGWAAFWFAPEGLRRLAVDAKTKVLNFASDRGQSSGK